MKGAPGSGLCFLPIFVLLSTVVALVATGRVTNSHRKWKWLRPHAKVQEARWYGSEMAAENTPFLKTSAENLYWGQAQSQPTGSS